jgi:hypothetical protein
MTMSVCSMIMVDDVPCFVSIVLRVTAYRGHPLLDGRFLKATNDYPSNNMFSLHLSILHVEYITAPIHAIRGDGKNSVIDGHRVLPKRSVDFSRSLASGA